MSNLSSGYVPTVDGEGTTRRSRVRIGQQPTANSGQMKMSAGNKLVVFGSMTVPLISVSPEVDIIYSVFLCAASDRTALDWL